jgi:hypothetical protein
MKLATLHDRKIVSSIIKETFQNNPSVLSILNKKGDLNKKIGYLADFAFIKAYHRQGVYLSDNQKGVAIFYKGNQSKFSLKETYYEIKFALLALPLWEIPSILKREAYMKKEKPKDGKYIYFWFLGVKKGGENVGFELKEIVLNEAKKENLPIYLETSVWRNVVVYKRYGFEVYDTWKDEKYKVTVWLMVLKPR